MKIKVFISSVQAEFASERQTLYEYILSDPLLGRFFDPFLFENLPATDQRTDAVYLREVEQSSIYLGVLGCKYGFEDAEGFSPTEREYDHLNAGKITNAALLLFGRDPQRFFISSEIRCASFSGPVVEKPIPSYKVFKGDVFELVDQAVEFVLSKLDYSVGTRTQTNSAPGKYEIPREIISEAIVNAVAHRDYTSNGSIQVMLFRDRLEIYNPGELPLGWTVDKLKKIHTSVPSNPLLAEPMYLKGYIERLGTGTVDMIRIALENGLKEPEFEQEDTFKVTIYRTSTGQVRTSTGQAQNEPATEVKNLVSVMTGELKRSEIMRLLELKHRESFVDNYLNPTLEQQYIRMKYPDTHRHPGQKYFLTEKGERLKSDLNNK